MDFPGLLSGPALALDGDTLRVAGVDVRLLGVAAPEIAHGARPADPAGPEAHAFVRRLVEGARVVCLLTGQRSAYRVVGLCLAAGTDVGLAVVAAGLARDCPAYSGGAYAAAESRARREGAQVMGLPLPLYCVPGRGLPAPAG